MMYGSWLIGFCLTAGSLVELLLTTFCSQRIPGVLSNSSLVIYLIEIEIFRADTRFMAQNSSTPLDD